jgi:hypothetical protein
MPDFADDDMLFQELERVLLMTHGLPDHVLEAGYAAFDWPEVDAELARIVEESSTVAVRGPGELLQLRFALDDFALELEVTATPEGQQVVGWLDEPARLELDVHHAGGSFRTQTDADGRFVLERLGRGAARIIVHRPGRQSIEVRWASQ